MKKTIAFRSFPETNDAFSTSIHGPSYGHDVTKQDPIKATLKKSDEKGSPAIGPLPVFKISPLGVTIDASDVESKASGAPLTPGQKCDLEIQVGSLSHSFNGLVVSKNVDEAGRELIGLRWCMPPLSTNTESDRRRARRWLCGEGYLPTGVAANPLLFNNFIYFSIVDISKEGVQLVTSLRNKLLIPGMTIDAIVSFPMVGQASMSLKILNARTRNENGKEKLGLGAKIIGADKQVLETMGQYILQFGPGSSHDELKSYGLQAKSVAASLDYCFVRTAEEYQEVLALRKIAYSKAEKAALDASDESMGDQFDSDSRIFLARHNGKAVGSFRLIFLDPDEQTEHERYVKFPENFPRRDEIINASRLCTHPDYRGSDLFFAIVRHMALAVVHSKKRYLVSGCTPGLLNVYKRFGFEGTGIRFKHGDLASVEEELIVWDAESAINGASVGPRIWNRVFSDLFDHLVSTNRIEVDALTSMRVKVYSMLGFMK